MPCLEKEMNETPDGMTDLQLTELIRKVGIPYFRGVRMMDKLPRKIKANESGVVNYQDSSEGGSHWIAYFNSKKYPAFVFVYDSMGMPVPERLKEYLEASGKALIYNGGVPHQKDDWSCGLWCVHFLSHMTDGDVFQAYGQERTE